MTAISERLSANRRGAGQLLSKVWDPFSQVPLLGWLFGALIVVVLERLIGTPLAQGLGMFKIPALFGFAIVLDEPALIPNVLLYMLLIYVLPLALVAKLSAALANQLAARLYDPLWVSVLIHLVLLYATVHVWSGVNDYRLLIARLILVAIMLTLSLNVVNGYMGEFSCSHPGFMALGAYTASVLTIVMFVDENKFGDALLPPALGPFLFPIILIIGGLVAALGAIFVAIPSFRTRGDYLAIISLAFMFIIKSLIENLEVVGGARGLGNQPNWANLPTVFAWTIACVWIINNFVRSILGKALNAVRDGEMAASAMTVDTRRTKMVAFLFAAFWAGVAGGLFAHVLRYVNPGTFDLKKLADIFAMLYLGGLNSVVGSIVGAVGYNLLSEAMRPLEIWKWIIIPLMIILVMIFRPMGLISFRDLDVKNLLKPKQPSDSGGPKAEEEVAHAVASR